MTNDSNTTDQRNELAILLANHDTAAGNFVSRSEAYDGRAAAILAEYLLIPRADLPEVTLSEHSDHGFTTALAQQRYQPRLVLSAEDGDREDGSWNRKIAYANLAIAEALDRHAVTEAETKLQERRDALAHALIMDGKVKHGEPWTYAGASPLLQRAVDRIIELEDAAEATR